MIRRQITPNRVRNVVGATLAVAFLFQCQQALSERNAGTPGSPSPVAIAKPDPAVAYAAPVRELPERILTVEELARQDPVAFFEGSLERYDKSVRNYTCTFTKQELLCGSMSDEQVMKAMFREKPFSVRLEWTKNADKAARVLYVSGEWIKDGQQFAVVEPAGSIARLFVSSVLRPIHGDDAKKSSRRTIDQFGLRNSMMLTLKYAKIAKEQGVLKQFEFVGPSKAHGRETLVFNRQLPYQGEGGAWPDRLLVIHIDKELRVPVLCESWADVEKTQLLGRYQISDLQLNVNLDNTVFTKEGMGL